MFCPFGAERGAKQAGRDSLAQGDPVDVVSGLGPDLALCVAVLDSVVDGCRVLFRERSVAAEGAGRCGEVVDSVHDLISLLAVAAIGGAEEDCDCDSDEHVTCLP